MTDAIMLSAIASLASNIRHQKECWAVNKTTGERISAIDTTHGEVVAKVNAGVWELYCITGKVWPK